MTAAVESPVRDLVELAIRRGLSIFPVGLDKKPLFEMRWKPYQERAPDPDQIARWRRMNPPAWAVITGAVSRIAILDFDGISGALLLRMNRLEPHVRTPSGGFHLWVAHPGWHVPTLNGKSDKKRLGELFPGLDIRGDGGYAVFTGHSSKGEYRWLRPMTPDPLDRIPERMRAALCLLHPPEVKPATVARIPTCPVDPSHLAEVLIRKALDVANTEGRNIAGFWLGTQARDNGFSPSEDWIVRRYCALTGSLNKKGEAEPFTESEALSCWRHAFDRPAREPWRGRRTS